MILSVMGCDQARTEGLGMHVVYTCMSMNACGEKMIAEKESCSNLIVVFTQAVSILQHVTMFRHFSLDPSYSFP